jgi:hypothetical protein
MTRTQQKTNKERLILKELIDKMFEIAGHPLKFEDVEGRTDNWFQQYTMTEAQNTEWRDWGTKFISKKRRFGIKLADREMRMLDLYCGLSISDSRFAKEENKITMKEQKKLLIEIMESDAKDGLYKQQTSVEWLFIQLYEKFEMKGDGKEMNAILKQAKAMEADKIVTAYETGWVNGDLKKAPRFGSDYYEQTFNK